MPTKGKCYSCGEESFLSLIMVQHDEDGHMEFWMVCQRCKEYYEWKGRQKHADGT